MSKVVVMGAGSWGTTLAVLLAQKGNDVTIWEYDKKNTENMIKYGENKTYLPGIKLPENIKITNEIKGLLNDVDVLVFSIPSQHLRAIVQKISGQITEDLIIVNTGKGIEIKSQERLSDVIKSEILGKYHKNVVVLSGPTHAEEVAKRIPSAIVAASPSKDTSIKIQELFNTETFRVYVNTDLIGVEIGGALKNCIAIAAGISDGMGYGDNSKSALMARGLAEISRFGAFFGAQVMTFSGLSGVGDLITTCTSKHSRNRHVGEKLGEGQPIEEILSNMVMVAEGIPTIKAVYEIAKTNKIEMPIVNSLYKIIYEGNSPKDITAELMGRELKEEFY